jgi:hypothetical protein
LRWHFVFMSASVGYPRFFKASSTPFHEQIMDFARLSPKAVWRSDLQRGRTNRPDT